MYKNHFQLNPISQVLKIDGNSGTMSRSDTIICKRLSLLNETSYLRRSFAVGQTIYSKMLEA